MVVTPLYAGLLALLLVILSLRVVALRRSAKAGMGDGGDVKLQRAIRAQANFAEYVPLALLLMLILEMSRFSIYVIHVLGIALVIGRLLHGYAMGFRTEHRFGRYWGALLTFVVLLVEAALCLYQGWLGHIVWFTT